MDIHLKTKLIKEAQKLHIDSPRNAFHEITHHYRTVLAAFEIMKNLQEKETFDRDLVEVLCWWHDIMIPEKETEGKRTAHTTAELLSEYFEGHEKEIVFDSIKNHEWGSTPQYIEGKILQDADKIEILSTERFRNALDAVKVGEYPKERLIKEVIIIYEEWLPLMLKRYNFDISRRIHETKLRQEGNRVETLYEDAKQNKLPESV